MQLSLRNRIILALLSAIGVSLVFKILFNFDSFSESAIFYGLSGFFFASGVLFPYITQDRFMHLRAVGLIAASIASYWAAVQIFDSGYFSIRTEMFAGITTLPNREWIDFLAASVSGTFVVMIALVLVAPARSSWTYVILGISASIAGGLIVSQTLVANSFLLTTLAYASWHTLICLAIYYGTRSNRERYQAIP